MMFKKWHITGLNKAKSMIAAVLVAVMMAGIPVSAATAEDFADLQANKNEWYYEQTSKAIELGIFQGKSENFFDVDGPITRAEFVTAVSRLCKVDVEPYQCDQFTDVVPGQWFYKPISWAYAMGLVNGTSPNEFSPDRPINRQEMCKLMGDVLETIFHFQLTTEGAATFTDQDEIDDWAVEWAKKCNVAGIFNGSDGAFNPKQIAPRHQAACVFYRCHLKVEEAQKPDQDPDPEQKPLDPAAYTLSVSGFDLDFHPETDYYLVTPADFDQCKIKGFTGFTALTVSVEQYATYYPYRDTPYQLGSNLKLGNGRAKVTLTATLPDGSIREYMIALTDPDASEYAYAKARVTELVNVRAEPNTNSQVLLQLVNNARVYYLKTEGDWCMVQLINHVNKGRIGYIHKNYLRWGWLDTEMPDAYKSAIEALQSAHPQWTFSFVDVEMTYEEALAQELEKYGASHEAYMNPLNYLAEDKIFAMLDIDSYTPDAWNDAGIKAIWTNEKGFSKEQAVEYFNATSRSLLMNPYYISCRAALESGYGTSKFAKGTVAGYEGYYNFFGIKCYDANPDVGAAYAKERNWNSVYRSIAEGANWVKDQYLDQGAVTPYFFRYAGFQNKVYMTDAQAPLKEASILKRAYTDPNAKAHFIIPVYREYQEYLDKQASPNN